MASERSRSRRQRQRDRDAAREDEIAAAVDDNADGDAAADAAVDEQDDGAGVGGPVFNSGDADKTAEVDRSEGIGMMVNLSCNIIGAYTSPFALSYFDQ